MRNTSWYQALMQRQQDAQLLARMREPRPECPVCRARAAIKNPTTIPPTPARTARK